jgi:hypothetical protein
VESAAVQHRDVNIDVGVVMQTDSVQKPAISIVTEVTSQKMCSINAQGHHQAISLAKKMGTFFEMDW